MPQAKSERRVQEGLSLSSSLFSFFVRRNEMSLGISFAKRISANKSLYRVLKPVADKYASIAGWRKVGLKYDDIIQEENDAVQTALSRLPATEAYDRAYRTRIASNASMLHKDLPKDQWLPKDKDTRYLTPLIEDVENEAAERAYWDGAEIVSRKK